MWRWREPSLRRPRRGPGNPVRPDRVVPEARSAHPRPDRAREDRWDRHHRLDFDASNLGRFNHFRIEGQGEPKLSTALARQAHQLAAVGARQCPGDR